MKLYVGNLPFSATESDVREFFYLFELDSVTLCTDRDTGRARGFGFVEITDEGAAREAVETLDGEVLGGRKLTINEAREKARGGKPRGDRGKENRSRGDGRGRTQKEDKKRGDKQRGDNGSDIDWSKP